jgi:hypothetical protein
MFGIAAIVLYVLAGVVSIAGTCAHIYFAIYYEEWILLIVGLVFAPLGVMIGLVRMLLVFLV